MMTYRYKMTQGADVGEGIGKDWMCTVQFEDGRVLYSTPYCPTKNEALTKAQKWVETEWGKHRRASPDGSITDGYQHLQRERSKQEERHEPEIAGNKD